MNNGMINERRVYSTRDYDALNDTYFRIVDRFIQNLGENRSLEIHAAFYEARVKAGEHMAKIIDYLPNSVTRRMKEILGTKVSLGFY